jgi:hypothetical protein
VNKGLAKIETLQISEGDIAKEKLNTDTENNDM